MRLGTRGRAETSAPSKELARATDVAARLVSGGGGGLRAARGLRVSALSRAEEVLALVGLGFAIRRASSLSGISSTGEKKEFGVCLHDGRSVNFDYWFPHFGVAIDLTDAECGDAEIATKMKWCSDRGILYLPPGTEAGVMRETVRMRREGRVST